MALSRTQRRPKESAMAMTRKEFIGGLASGTVLLMV